MKDCKEWIVPQELINAQGYYEGQARIWLPKVLMQNQKSSTLSQEDRPQKSHHINQWKTMRADSAKNPSGPSKVPKDTQGSHLNQAIIVREEQKWVPKKLAAVEDHQTSSKPTIKDKSKMGP